MLSHLSSLHNELCYGCVCMRTLARVKLFGAILGFLTLNLFFQSFLSIHLHSAIQRILCGIWLNNNFIIWHYLILFPLIFFCFFFRTECMRKEILCLFTQGIARSVSEYNERDWSAARQPVTNTVRSYGYFMVWAQFRWAVTLWTIGPNDNKHRKVNDK